MTKTKINLKSAVLVKCLAGASCATTPAAHEPSNEDLKSYIYNMNYDKTEVDLDAETTYQHHPTYLWTNEKGYLGKKRQKDVVGQGQVPDVPVVIKKSPNLKEDQEFAKYFETPPDLSVGTKRYCEIYPETPSNISVLEKCYARFGSLNFSKLIEDNEMMVVRDPSNSKIVPINKVQFPFKILKRTKDTQAAQQIVIKEGQLDERCLLEGIGRKIRLYEHGADIWEGQFLNDKLHGFGRHIKVYCEQIFWI